MDNHYGQIVEYVVRKNGHSITDLATALDVNRRSIYNYFQNPNLKYDIIYKIGLIIRHDFSKEFPELFTSDQFEVKPKHFRITPSTIAGNSSITHWKDKYIELLETYNEALKNGIRNREVSENVAV